MPVNPTAPYALYPEGEEGNPYAFYFGPSNGAVNSITSNDSLANAYARKNRWLEERMVTDVKTDDRIQVVESILPIVRTKDKTVKWRVIRTDRRPLGPAAPKTESEIFRFTVEEYEGRTEMHAAGIEVELNFHKTEEGAQRFVTQYDTIIGAIAETLYENVQRAFIDSRNDYATRAHLADRSPLDIAGLNQNMRRMWGAVNRGDIAALTAHMRYTLFAEPDTWIFPPLSSQLLTSLYNPTDKITAINGIRVVELRPPANQYMDPDTCLLHREHAIGHYTMMDAPLTDPKLAKSYYSGIQDVSVPNFQGRGTYSRITLLQAIAASPYFSTDTAAVTPNTEFKPWWRDSVKTNLTALDTERYHCPKGSAMLGTFPPHVLAYSGWPVGTEAANAAQPTTFQPIVYFGDIHPNYAQCNTWKLLAQRLAVVVTERSGINAGFIQAFNNGTISNAGGTIPDATHKAHVKALQNTLQVLFKDYNSIVGAGAGAHVHGTGVILAAALGLLAAGAGANALNVDIAAQGALAHINLAAAMAPPGGGAARHAFRPPAHPGRADQAPQSIHLEDLSHIIPAIKWLVPPDAKRARQLARLTTALQPENAARWTNALLLHCWPALGASLFGDHPNTRMLYYARDSAQMYTIFEAFLATIIDKPPLAVMELLTVLLHLALVCDPHDTDRDSLYVTLAPPGDKEAARERGLFTQVSVAHMRTFPPATYVKLLSDAYIAVFAADATDTRHAPPLHAGRARMAAAEEQAVFGVAPARGGTREVIPLGLYHAKLHVALHYNLTEGVAGLLPFEKCMARIYMLAHCSPDNVMSLITADALLPFKPLLIRSQEVYKTGSPILCKTGASLGLSLYTDEEVNTHIIPEKGMMFTAFNIHTAAIIRDPSLFMWGEHSVINRYIQGANDTFVHPGDAEGYGGRIASGEPNSSWTVDLVPLELRPGGTGVLALHDPISIFGYHEVEASRLGVAPGADCSWPGARLYAAMYFGNDAAQKRLTNGEASKPWAFMSPDDSIRVNTCCYQSAAFVIDARRRAMDRIIHSTGPWGPVLGYDFTGWTTGLRQRTAAEHAWKMDRVYNP